MMRPVPPVDPSYPPYPAPASPPPGPRRRARGWGVASVVSALLGVAPVAAVLALAFGVDQNYGWLLIPAFGWVFVTGSVGTVLGVVGLVLAVIDRRCFTWPVLGTLGSAGTLVAVLAVVSA